MELILKEKDFRAALLTTDWSVYRDKIVGVIVLCRCCDSVWAYMLVTSYLQPLTKEVVMGDEATVLRQILTKRIQAIDPNEYKTSAS
ncbi:MAG: DUF2480 family protein [Puia sp.]